MATFDQLPDDQRAVLNLVIRQGRGYEQLGAMLSLSTSRVRELAVAALVRLAPVTAAGVEAERRGALVDYLLHQQTAEERAATVVYLERSEAARGWARSVLDSLDELYANGQVPEIPTADSRPARKPSTNRQRSRRRVPSARGALSVARRVRAARPRTLAAALVGVAALLALLVWPVGLLMGSGDEPPSARKRSGKTAQAQVLGQLTLQRVGKARSSTTGVAVIAQSSGKQQLYIEAKLTPTKNRQAYEVWFYNSRRDAKSLGAQTTNKSGTFQGAGALPSDFARYRYIDISLENVDGTRGHSGQSVLRGRIDQIQAPQTNAGTTTTPPSGAAPQSGSGATPQTTAPQTTPQKTPGQ